IVRDYLLENPEVIVEVLQRIQERRQQAQREQYQANLVSAQDGIFDETRDPFAGNPEASVTVVEFFDYHCPFCKRMANGIALLTEQDDDVKVVFKEFPVFGPESVFAARAALASKKQGMYREFHLALMRNRGRLNESIVMRLADRVGLDTDRLREDMQAPEIEETIRHNLQLAQRLGIRGTPSFIIGDELVPGALDISTMRRLIQAKRQS
ncbi:MAG: DsbA family protein, partial [Alphaproteobacteria bacterium]